MDKNNISFEDRSFYSMDTLPTEMVVEWGRAGNYKKIGGAAGKNKKCLFLLRIQLFHFFLLLFIVCLTNLLFFFE